MGAHLQIFVAHNLANNSLSTVVQKFQPVVPLFEDISRYYSQWFQLKPVSEAWRDVGDPTDPQAALFNAPGGFNFSFGARTLRMHHLTKFHLFCTNSVERDLLRGFAHQTVRLMSGDKAIYSTDQGIGDEISDRVLDGQTLGEIEEHLLRLGAPATSFAELDVRQAPQPIYYVDRFDK